MSASELRILTVRQPWAWAIVHGGKDIENRSRTLGPYRGPVAIHVAGKYAVDGLELPALDEACLAWTEENDLPLGVNPPWWASPGRIIGVVDLIDVHHDDADRARGRQCSDSWAEVGMHHLVLANPRPLSTPVPYRGALGLRHLPDEVAAAVWAEVAS